MKRRQTIGLVTSCLVTQDELGQTPGKGFYATQSVTERSKETESHTGGANVCDAEKAGPKEAHTVSMALTDQHFNLYGLPDQLDSDKGKELVNNLWRELFSEFKIQHTKTLTYNSSLNSVKCLHRTLMLMLRSRGPGVQDNWNLWLNASVFAYNTTVSSRTGVMLHYAMFRCEAT